LTSVLGLNARSKIVQDAASLLAANRHHAQGPLHETALSLAVRSATDPTSDHSESQRSLRRVVRRLEPARTSTDLLHFEDFQARPRRCYATSPRSLYSKE